MPGDTLLGAGPLDRHERCERLADQPGHVGARLQRGSAVGREAARERVDDQHREQRRHDHCHRDEHADPREDEQCAAQHHDHPDWVERVSERVRDRLDVVAHPADRFAGRPRQRLGRRPPQDRGQQVAAHQDGGRLAQRRLDRVGDALDPGKERDAGKEREQRVRAEPCRLAARQVIEERLQHQPGRELEQVVREHRAAADEELQRATPSSRTVGGSAGSCT